MIWISSAGSDSLTLVWALSAWDSIVDGCAAARETKPETWIFLEATWERGGAVGCDCARAPSWADSLCLRFYLVANMFDQVVVALLLLAGITFVYVIGIRQSERHDQAGRPARRKALNGDIVSWIWSAGFGHWFTPLIRRFDNHPGHRLDPDKVILELPCPRNVVSSDP
jgi:hypothetical protein